MRKKGLAPKEHDVQKAIVDCLRLAGLTVYETTAYRQEGTSGVDKGIPDLLVVHPLIPCHFIGLEVKPPGKVKFSSPEQERAWLENHFVIVQSEGDALREVKDCISTYPHFKRSREWLAKIDRVIRALGGQ